MQIDGILYDRGACLDFAVRAVAKACGYQGTTIPEFHMLIPGPKHLCPALSYSLNSIRLLWG
jgi:hypothetical protein